MRLTYPNLYTLYSPRLRCNISGVPLAFAMKVAIIFDKPQTGIVLFDFLSAVIFMVKPSRFGFPPPLAFLLGFASLCGVPASKYSPFPVTKAPQR